MRLIYFPLALVIGVGAALGFGAFCQAFDIGHTSYTEVQQGCVVEVTEDFWGHRTNEERVCPR